ncbi:hypothetical protein PUN28_000496 [Cardiocondyla obscurior]|uniref:Uncharacterized protein n=1 Tax=Cardiocondyla obscurior TaxID=286306 RepID=A0AAW2GZU8_9HYME
MLHKYVLIYNLTCLVIFSLSEILFANGESESDYLKGCASLRCTNGSQCVKRRFWCKNPPCPGMLYCSKSRRESLKGPLNCETVRCSKGYRCIIKVKGCHWDGKCNQQLARCVSEEGYYEGAVSCVGIECAPGKRCILRETYCANPPCKLIRSCKSAKDVQISLDKCKSLNCTSEYECFLRNPENNCLNSWCTHTPDCTLSAGLRQKIENKEINHSYDLSDNHANSSATKKINTAPSSVRDKELDNYYNDEWRPWYIIYDYLEQNEPQSIRKRRFKSSIDDDATDDFS